MGSADKLSKIILNPVRMRIIQFLMIHGRGTASQFKEALWMSGGQFIPAYKSTGGSTDTIGDQRNQNPGGC